MKLKKLLSSVLAASMLLSSMAFTAFAEDATTPTYTAVITSADDLGVGAEGEYSTVYYGGIPWRVLDKEFSDGQEESKDGIYLLSEYAYGYGTFWNAHYGPGDYVWGRTGIFTRLDVLYHPDGYNGDPGNTSPTNLGYQASDIRKYMTGIGEYEAVYPRSMHEHGNPDNSGLNVSSYFWKTKVTDEEPTPGVEYYIKGEFKLSNCEFNNYETLAVGASDWLPDTWYVKDEATGEFKLVEEAPAEGETLICYHDATEYYKVGELENFEDGVDYYTFEKISEGMPEWEYTKLEMQSNSIAKGALYCAFTVTDMKESTSVDTEGEGRVILSGENNRSFASDMGFSDIEKAAVLPTNRMGATNGGARTPSLWTYKNSGAYSDTFVNDTYFLPTAADLNTYLDDNGISKAATYANGDAAQYWLSSLLRYDRVGMVDGGGGEWYQHPTFKSLGIRPAFNLNPDAVVMYVPAEDDVFAKMTEGNNEYKMVMLDDARADFTYTVTPSENGATITYENAIVGENEWITAVVIDADGNITHYGEVAEVEAANGTVELAITGEEMVGKQLYIFNEQCNGDYETNYSNAFGEGFKIVTSKTLAEALEDMEHSETLAVQTENNGIVEVVKINDEEFEVAERYIKINDNAEGIEVTVPGIIEVAVEEGNGQKDYKVVVDLEKTSYDSEVATVDLDISLKCTYNGVTEDVEANGKKFEVTVKLPENADLSVIPTVYHNGVEISDVKVVGGCVVFTTDGFSPYAISYQLKAVNAPAVDEMCSAAQVNFVPAEENENNTIYDIVIESTDGKDIFGLVSAQMDISEDADMSGVNFTVEGANDFIVTDNEADDSYLFTLKTANNQALADTKSGESVKIGKLTISGFTTDIETGVVGTYTVNATIDANDGAGTSYLDTDVTPNETKNIFIALTGNSIDYEKDVPKNELTIEVTFPKNINDNNYNYQDMKITVTEQDLGTVAEFDLGVAGDAQIDDNKYTVSAELQRYKTYTVKIEGAGYRTFTKTVDLDADKTMIVWNNYKDNGALIIKDGETTPEAVATITFLAGDIVKDNTVNAYDLSVLLSYAFTDGIDTTAASKYAQYDLNRDGLINYKDAAMILDTYVWGK